MNEKIVVLGSCNTDMVIKSERLPVPGETILGGQFLMNPGGKGANQAVAASRLGGDVTFICKTGNDIFGQEFVELFKKESIKTEYVFKDEDLPSGVALITVDKSGENSIVVASGANSSLSKSDIDTAKEAIENAELLLMQLETPLETVMYTAEIANNNGVKVILNPAPAPAESLPVELLENLHMIIPNNTEAQILSGIEVNDWETARQAADVISSLRVTVVVITLGAMGAFVKDGDQYHEIKVESKLDVVDTTAAGDTFCGALCVALAEGAELKEAVEFANRAAGISVTRMGAQASIPYRNELEIKLT
ncbi:MAG: ribokinase [Draconibacterium sp.]